MEITLYVNETESGPHTLEEVQGMIANGELTKEDFAYFEGCSDWVPVADIPGIDDVAEEPAAEEEAAPAAADAGGEAILYIWPEGAEDWDGPYTLGQIQEKVAAGEVTTADYASGFEGCAEGATIADIPGIDDVPAAAVEEEPAAEEEYPAEEEAEEEAPAPGKKRAQFKKVPGGKEGFAKKAGLGMKKGGVGGAAKKGGMAKKGGLAKKGGAKTAGAGAAAAKKGAAKKGAGAAKKGAAKKAAAAPVEVADGELSETSFTKTYFLCAFFGVMGVHRFATGKVGSGVGMLLTGGGLGIWWFVDMLMIILLKFKDKEGRLVAMAPQEEMSEKNLSTILLIWHLVPIPGMHRFLTGRAGSGVAFLLTGGGLLVWMIIDWIKLVKGQFTDKEGLPVLATKS